MALIGFGIFLNFSFCFAGENAEKKFKAGLETTRMQSGYNDAKLATTPSKIIALIIKAALSLIGVIFLVLLIYSGYRWMTAQGNEQEMAEARKTIIAAIIGLAVVLGAYMITIFIMDYWLKI